MRNKKKYPYGTIPSRKDVERFREKNTQRYYPAGTSKANPSEEDSRKLAPFGPITIEDGELEALYKKTKDWTAVYASYNID